MTESAKIDKKTNILMKIINILTPILMAFLVAVIPIILKGENPFVVYGVLIKGTLFDSHGILVVLHYMAPLILSGLAIAVSFKAGLFNMGIESSILVGGFTVAVVGYNLKHLPPTVLIPLLLIVGILMGVLTSVIPALLKAYLNINEMVVTLLLNYAIIEILLYLATNQFRNPLSGFVSTHAIGINGMFKGILNSPLTGFFIIAILVFSIMLFTLNKTKFGFAIESIGKNTQFSEAVGLRVRKSIIIIFLVSGALGGLAGAGWMMTEKYSYTASFSGNPGLGWDGMVISLLGGHTALGVLLSAFFYGILKVGGTEISYSTNVPSEIIGIIQALLILFLSIKLIKDKNSPLYFRLKQMVTNFENRFKKKDKEVKDNGSNK